MQTGENDILFDDSIEDDIDEESEEIEEGKEERETGDNQSNNKSDRDGFLATYLAPGKIFFITAPMREGKTNQASSLMEKAIAKDYDIYTNVLFFKENRIDEAIEKNLLSFPREHYIPVPDKIHLVTTASELIRELYKTRIEKKSITILDEALFFAGAKRGTSKILRWFEELVVTIGKLGSSLVIICQVKSMLAAMLKEDLPSHEFKVYKLQSGKRNVELWFNESGKNAPSYYITTRRNVPPSRYPFDSIAPASFNFDIDMEKFVNRISKLDSLECQDEIPRVLDELLSENNGHGVVNKKSKTEVIKEIIENDPSLSTSEIMVLLLKRDIKCHATLIEKVRRYVNIKQ